MRGTCNSDCGRRCGAAGAAGGEADPILEAAESVLDGGAGDGVLSRKRATFQQRLMGCTTQCRVSPCQFLPPADEVANEGANVGLWQILLQKSFWGGERKF
jgi:hypothetical protein